MKTILVVHSANRILQLNSVWNSACTWVGWIYNYRWLYLILSNFRDVCTACFLFPSLAFPVQARVRNGAFWEIKNHLTSVYMHSNASENHLHNYLQFYGVLYYMSSKKSEESRAIWVNKNKEKKNPERYS